MSTKRAAVIGCGRRVLPDGKIRRGISYSHGAGYALLDTVEIVAVADIQPENAAAYVEHFELTAEVFTDYQELLAAVRPDVVSICTWPALHTEMVLACAAAGVPAIHCEKPMALTFGEAKQMLAACEAAGSQLTFNHQRRFGASFQKARQLVEAGAIGDLRRGEGRCPNLYDWGTHWFDILFYLNGQSPALWVLGGVDRRSDASVFGAPLETFGSSWFGFENGVEGTLLTGQPWETGPAIRLLGSDGMIEVLGADGGRVRYLSATTSGWVEADLTGLPTGPAIFAAALADVLRCLETGERPLLSAHHAIMSTEVMFATYESVRRRARVDLPLDIDDSPLQAMIAAGLLGAR